MGRLLNFLSLCCLSMPVIAESICYGTTSKGRLENAVELPRSGKNFVTYSDVARLAGRTYVHSKVHDILLAAYADLAKSHPDKVYKYAETGLAAGGKFRPHKTHQNGLSVDFMTPMIDNTGKSVHLPTYPWNKFGYNIELDSNNQYDGLSIDYPAMAAHIVALHKQARAHGVGLWRVIFAPELQKGLFKTQYGGYLKQHVKFSKRRSWVRHDEHYHVDFAVPCRK
ncbi:penicillin-insensitive murein endopeptidase [Motilimonas sp. E26]|uniref:penicillin-insensitive murein endopeptidase n=2 Tax=unclassified Motilimonas TaxID=2643697 RepID=UPI001E4A6806|nr:penicillin-insensitive murein endopeptidase [Motilimonas sp. E26]MCE0556333.1 penicillin-insensitive murein endopeptidase [Motilimonas sp. E26]